MGKARVGKKSMERKKVTWRRLIDPEYAEGGSTTPAWEESGH